MDAAADPTTREDTSFENDAIPYMRQLYPVALRLTKNPCDAEDLVQDTFARAYVKFYQFTPGTNLGAWLYRILLSTFYSKCRQRGRRPAEVLALSPEEYPAGHATPPSRSAEAEALDGIGDSDVLRALAGLPSAYKSVIYLADIESYRYNEIADVLGIPLGTVMSRVHRGRAMLRAKISQPRAANAPVAARPAFPATRQEATRLAA
jgi:RNA polymerase sigma-70 factor, ECF subfamily